MTRLNEIKLPVALQRENNSYLYHALPMCVLKTTDKYDTWLIEHNVNIYHVPPIQTISFDYQSHTFLGFGNKMLSCEFLPKYLFYRNICSVLEERIEREQQYAYIVLDEFCLPAKRVYQQTTRVHDSLIYGFNRENKEFYAITDGAKSGVLHEVTYSYEDIEKAYSAMVENIYYPEQSLIFLKLNFDYDPTFSFEKYFDALTRYANGLPSHEYIFNGHWNNLGKTTFGIDVYNSLIEHFNEKESLGFNDFRCVHFLYEHKSILLKSYNYLLTQNIVADDFAVFIDEYGASKNMISRIRNQMLKYLELQEQNHHRERLDDLKRNICDSLQKYKMTERTICIRIIETLKRLLFNDNALPSEVHIAFKKDSDRNLVDCAEIEAIDKSMEYEDKHGYTNCKRFVLQWPFPVYIKKAHLRCKGLICLSVNNKEEQISVNTITNYRWEYRLVSFCQVCSSLTLDVFTQEDIQFGDLELTVIEGSLTAGKSVIASSCWLMDDGEPLRDALPFHVLTDSDKFWNAQREFSGCEWIEIDFNEETAINRIIIQERKDIARIRNYYVEFFDNQNVATKIAEHQGSMQGDPIIHDFPLIHAYKLRLTITQIEPDQYGYYEPGICHFNAYYFEDISTKSMENN